MVDEDAVAAEAVDLAASWQNRAHQLLTAEEKGIQEQMMRLLTHPVDKVILTQLIDQSFRSHDPNRVADQVSSILHRFGVPDFFSGLEKILIQMFLGLGRHFPTLSVPGMIEKMRHASSRAIIPGERRALHAHLDRRRKQNVRVNVNRLGEALPGEAEAFQRMEMYRRDLRNPRIEYISIKISTIYSQINPLAFDATVTVLKERLTDLYLESMRHFFERPDGRRIPKFVNLDMEAYSDMEITFRAFIAALDQRPLKNCSAGIVLQAYMPEAHLYQQELTAWARRRTADGGAPVKLRIVKGANMEMEQIEAALNNWPLTPYNNKKDVDANFKRMVDYGMAPENIPSVHLGIASHNLFDLAYAYALGRRRAVTKWFYFEMLEGMADHVRRALRETVGDVLLYAPVAGKEEFINGIAYLVRRLDENTAPQNFLRYAPGLTVDSKEWRSLKDAFITACRHRNQVKLGPNRTQNRRTENPDTAKGPFFENAFRNEPDTDWSQPANRQWAADIRSRWKKAPGEPPVDIPLVIAGQTTFKESTARRYWDLSQLPRQVCTARCAMAGASDIDRAVRTARQDPDGWRGIGPKERHEILAAAACELRRRRADLIGAAAAVTGKVFSEADSEVSEAVDFTEYYPYSAGLLETRRNLVCRGRGVCLVISPWNFPIAIPCGGVAAALAAGNTVLLKPASAAAPVAWLLCEAFWRGGVSQNTLQFIPCDGETAGSTLTRHPDIDAVLFTGGTQTALAILKQRPDLFMAAETGGKNATIVTDMADRDQAIQHIIHSAFSNCGQKCSATSLLILEKPVYEDEKFRTHLVDAARSYAVGSAWEFHNKMGPLVSPPSGKLAQALTRLEPGESWALKPQQQGANPCLWTPGIKWDVRPGGFTHLTEFFGPLLAVMPADSLDHAIALANQTGYGLTAALESLDAREHERFKARLHAGNLYINRGSTGAVVLRQPFGGMGKSAIGAGIKVGSPDYVTQLMTFSETGFPTTGPLREDRLLLQWALQWERELDWGAFAEDREDLQKTVRAVQSYLFEAEQTFLRENDFFHLRGQDNILRYRPVDHMLIRISDADSLFEILARLAAARIAGCRRTVSLPPGLESRAVLFLKSPAAAVFTCDATWTVHRDDELTGMLEKVDRIRYAAPQRVPAALSAAAAAAGRCIAGAPVLMDGRLELLQYFQQQSICVNYHRYGNLGERSRVQPQ